MSQQAALQKQESAAAGMLACVDSIQDACIVETCWITVCTYCIPFRAGHAFEAN